MSESTLEPARGKRLLFAYKLCLFVGLAAALSWEAATGLLDPAKRNDREGLGMSAAMAVLGVGALLAAVRSAVALGQARPHLRLDLRGIHVRVWRERWADAWRWCPRWTELLISWEEFRDCGYRSRRGVETVEIRYAAGGVKTKSVSFSSHLFDRQPGEMMTAILNYHEVVLPQLCASAATGVGPGKANSAGQSHDDAFLEVMRFRFRVPRRVQGASPTTPAMIFLLGVVIVAAAFAMLFADASGRMERWFWGPVIAGFLLFLGGGYVAGSRWSNRRQRCLEFQANGFGVGPSFSQLKCYAWESVGTSRLIETYSLDRGGAKTGEGLAERLEIVLKDGRTLVFPDGYDHPLKELYAWFSP